MKPHETGTDNPIDFPIAEDELKTTVRSFFEDFIDIREESDSGRVFAPVTISSCRCMMVEPLAEVLAKMRTLSGATKGSE